MPDDTERDSSTEESQDERGEPGSRDQGESGAGGGPTDRPADDSDIEDETGVNPSPSVTDDSPHLQGG